MKIGIDVTFLFDQYAHRGIGTYAREVIRRLLQNEQHNFVLFGFKDLKSNLKELDVKPASNITFIGLGKPRKSNVSNGISFRLKTRRKIIKSELDLYFAPHFERGLPVGKVKTAVMVHDAIPFLTNSYSQKNPIANYLKGIFYRRNLKAARKADLVLTNSEFTKKELVRKVKFQEEKITVTHLAVSESFKKENIQTDTRSVRRILVLYKITKPYLLYYGGLEANKNTDYLLQTFVRISNKHPDLKFVIAGKEFKLGWDGKAKPLTASAHKLLETVFDLKLQHKVIFTSEVKQQHLPVVLQNSEGFISLSGYEGFGLSVLEAITAGVPVIAAAKSSYPEILGSAALLVDPKDPVKTSEKILHLLQDDSAKQKLQKLGYAQSGKYNWRKTAEQTLTAFEETLTKTPKLRITYLIARFYPEQGGAETNCYNLAKNMADLGHQVTILTSNNIKNSFPKDEELDGFLVKRFRKFNNQYYLGFYPGILFALLFTKADLIHVHGFGFIWQDFALLLKRFFSPRTKFINTPHGPFMAHGNYGLIQVLLKKSYTFVQRMFLSRLYKRFIQVNPEQYLWMRDYGIKEEKIIYLPNGINETALQPVKPTKLLEKMGLKRKFVISYTGRFEEYKGLQTVIKILPELIKLKPNLRLVAMGRGGSYLPHLRTLAKNLTIEKYVEFLVNPDDKTRDEILGAAKIFVMPSRWEAFGISILEAMARNNAIVSTDTEGGKFLIKNSENGFLYKFGDDKGLLKIFEKLMNDPKLLAKIQKANKDKAGTFIWESIAEDYQKEIFNLF